MERHLLLRIIVEQAPTGVLFGLQKGKGGQYQTIQLQEGGRDSLQFEFIVTIRNNSRSIPDFFGEHVQGPQNERFIYLDIGTYADQQNTAYSRRLKIPLYTIDRQTINHIMMNKDTLLETTVPGTGKDGGPNCGTVKPFEGWRIKTNTPSPLKGK